MSVIQHRIIQRMFPRAKVTLLADTNQAIIPELNTCHWEKLASIYNAKTLNLNKSYRSTKQINSFALKLLPENSRYEIFEREGEEVNVAKGGFDGLSSLAQRVSQNSKTLAIITKTADDAREVYTGLKKVMANVRLCDNKSCEMGNAPVVMPLSLTKGLEFDSVIIADKDGAFTEKGNERYLYLASTRALHKLNIFSY